MWSIVWNYSFFQILLSVVYISWLNVSRYFDERQETKFLSSRCISGLSNVNLFSVYCLNFSNCWLLSSISVNRIFFARLYSFKSFYFFESLYFLRAFDERIFVRIIKNSPSYPICLALSSTPADSLETFLWRIKRC